MSNYKIYIYNLNLFYLEFPVFQLENFISRNKSEVIVLLK